MGNKRKLEDDDDDKRSDNNSQSDKSDWQRSANYLPLCVKRRQVVHDHNYNLYQHPTAHPVGILNVANGLLPKTPDVMVYMQHWGYEVTSHFTDDYGFEEYSDDIFRHKLRMEELHQPFHCLKNQPQINEMLRVILVRWLTEIHHKMNLCQETLFVSVNIIDRFLARMVIIPESLQMVGLTSLFIASKYEEISSPTIIELLSAIDMTKVDRVLMQRLERIILKVLSFSLGYPSSLYFVEHYAAIYLENSDVVHIGTHKKSLSLSRLLLELFLQDYQLCQFKPSLLALCTWLLTISENGHLERYNSFIPEEYRDNILFEDCLNKVNQQIKNIRCQYPNIDSLCDNYPYSYS